MLRSFKIASAASLLAAFALTLNTVPTNAAEAHASRTRRPRDLATAFEAIYGAAYTNGFSSKDPIVRGRRARRLAVDTIVSAIAGDGQKSQPGNTPADEAAGKAAAAALNAGPPGFQNCRVMFAYHDAYWAAFHVLPGGQDASPDQAARIAAFAVASAVSRQIAADESAGNKAADEHNAAKSDDPVPAARDQHRAAYDAAYKAVYQIIGTNSKTPEYDHCMAAYAAAKSQLTKDHAEPNERLVKEVAISALFDAGRDWKSKQPLRMD